MEKFREQFKKEKNFTYWAEGCDYGSFNDKYVNWLEKKLALTIRGVSKRYFVATDINYLNEVKVISQNFENKQDAESFKEHCKNTEKYKNTELIIINVC